MRAFDGRVCDPLGDPWSAPYSSSSVPHELPSRGREP